MEKIHVSKGNEYVTKGCNYHISSTMTAFFSLPKQSKKPRSVLKDRSRSFGLFRKGNICTIAKFDTTGLVICSRSKEGKTPSYSQINKVE